MRDSRCSTWSIPPVDDSNQARWLLPGSRQPGHVLDVGDPGTAFDSLHDERRRAGDVLGRYRYGAELRVDLYVEIGLHSLAGRLR